MSEEEQLEFYLKFCRLVKLNDQKGIIKLFELAITNEYGPSNDSDFDFSAEGPPGYYIEIKHRVTPTAKYNLAVTLSRPTPPATAEKILSYLLAPDRLEEAVGDFEDGFALMATRHGIGHARRWYCWQVLRIALGGAFDVLWKVLKALGGFGGDEF